MTEIWFNTKRSSVQIECASDKRVRSLRQIRTISVANPKKFMETFVLFQIFLPSKWPSVHIEVSFDNRAEFFFRQNSVLACLKSQSQKKEMFFAKTSFFSKHSSVQIDGSLKKFFQSYCSKIPNICCSDS